MQQFNNQPQGEEGIGRRPTSGDSNKERRASELIQQLNNQLTYGNKRDGSGRWQRKQAKEMR